MRARRRFTIASHSGFGFSPSPLRPVVLYVNSELTTHWSMIDAAAKGGAVERDEFAQRYAEPARAYLGGRWRSPLYQQFLDDAVQEVFVQCFRAGGPLERADRERGRFRDYYLGVVKKVAAAFERRHATELQRSAGPNVDVTYVIGDETSLSVVYDRSWAQCMMKHAVRRQRELATRQGDAAVRRVELLRMRFEVGLPIRDIARIWNADPAGLHHEYAKARKEFKAALFDVVALHSPGSPAEIARECEELQKLLG